MSKAKQTGENAYRAAGIDYDALDAGKRAAQDAALKTSPALKARGGLAIDDSRGEPAFVFEFQGQKLAQVLEGLGTKSIIARQVHQDSDLKLNRFSEVAYDTVAAIVNDLCCVGARPLVVNAYFATGASDWYKHGQWPASLVAGWQRACEDAGCTWGGGESPTLPELVSGEDIELAGSAVGVIPDRIEPVLGQNLKSGDEIVFLSSSGIHANGSSLARLIAAQLPDGYSTPLADGTSFGAALLEPTTLYSPVVEALIDAGIPISYLSHITGHGFSKLMRPQRDFRYRIHTLQEVPPVLEFMVNHAKMSPDAAYGTFNMGTGFAIYVPPGTAQAVIAAASEFDISAQVCGVVEEGPRSVVVEPIDVEFLSDRLQLAPSRHK